MPRAWAKPQAGTTVRQPARRRIGVDSKQIAVVALLIAAVMLTIGLVVNRGTSRAAPNKSRIDRTVGALLAGIPQQGDTLGQPTAPVTLQFYGDLECLTTKVWVTGDLPAIVKDFVRRGVMKIEYRSFKTDTIDPRVFVEQQAAALAAGAQDKLWDFVETFYYEQGAEYTPYATERYLDGIASQVPGLNLPLWHRDWQVDRRGEQVQHDDQTARTLQLHDTPAFRIGLSGKPLRRLEEGQTVFFRGQKYPVTLIDAQNVANAIRKILG